MAWRQQSWFRCVLLGEHGTVAVISPVAMRSTTCYVRFVMPRSRSDARVAASLDLPVTLLGAVASKGLEFDAVIVVEPGAILAESTSGARALFVAMTLRRSTPRTRARRAGARGAARRVGERSEHRGDERPGAILLGRSAEHVRRELVQPTSAMRSMPVRTVASLPIRARSSGPASPSWSSIAR